MSLTPDGTAAGTPAVDPTPATGGAAPFLRRERRRRLAVAVLIAALLAAVGVHALGHGAYPLSVPEVLRALAAGPTGPETAAHVIWSIRLPRLLAAVLAGMGLAAAGAAMQSVLHNPLASPLTLGVSQGAALGATCAIVLLGAGELHRVGPDALSIHRPSVVVLAALAGGLGTAAAILAIATLRALRPEALVLTRLALGADHRWLLPVAALTGALVLLAADTLARLVLAPAVLPVGAVTALLGAPLLLVLLVRGAPLGGGRGRGGPG